MVVIKRNRLNIVGILTFCIVPIAIQAQVKQRPYYLDAAVGMARNAIQSSVTVPFPEPNPYHLSNQAFATDTDNKLYAEVGLRGGKLFTLHSHWSMALGLGFYANLPQKNNGTYYAIAGGTASYRDYYSMSAYRAMLEGRVYYQASHQLSYYLGVGAGMARIHTSGLTYLDANNMPVPGESIGQIPKSTNYSHSAFSATAGLDYMLTQQVHLDVGLNKLYMGDSKITVNDGHKDVVIKNGSIDPWKVSLAISFHF